MEINIVTDPDEIRHIVPVIKSAWGMESMDQLVKDIVAAMRFHGGLVLLAREADEVIGMHFSFPGFRNGKTYLYSHMTGVTHQDKYRGVGEALKLAQKEWAGTHGYDLIAWTYDPLMALNAHFNINKLGAVVRTYLRNFYGSMEDALNFGLPTDRFVAEWWINYTKPKIPSPEVFLNSPEAFGKVDMDFKNDCIGLYIPKDFVSMKRNDKDSALNVRMSLRSALEKAFKNKYDVVDFNKNGGYYVLWKNMEFEKTHPGRIFDP